MPKNQFDDIDNVEELIYRAIGAGSMCWIPDTGALEFDSSRAAKIGEDTIARLGQIIGGL